MHFQLFLVLRIGCEKNTVLLKHSEDILIIIRKQNCKKIISDALNRFDIFNTCFTRCPKTVENFCVHSRNGYYNGHTFHRIIKVSYANFMIKG